MRWKSFKLWFLKTFRKILGKIKKNSQKLSNISKTHIVNPSWRKRFFIVIINLLNNIISPSAIWLPNFFGRRPWFYRQNRQFRSCDWLRRRWFLWNFPTTRKWIKNIPLNYQCVCRRLLKCEWLYERCCKLTMLNQIYANFRFHIFFLHTSTLLPGLHIRNLLLRESTFWKDRSNSVTFCRFCSWHKA